MQANNGIYFPFCYVSGSYVSLISMILCGQEGEIGGKLMTFETTTAAKSTVPVVKAKATSLMSSIMISKSTKQTQLFPSVFV